MLLRSFKMAVSSILQNKTRSFLTMLGIIIGVMAVVVLVSIVSSSTDAVTGELESLGAETLNVSVTGGRTQTLSLDEVNGLAAGYPSIGAAAPTASSSVTARAGSTSATASVVGTTHAYAEINDLSVQSGRFLKTPDVDNITNVAVLGIQIAEDLFGRTDVVGETVSLDGRIFLVAGVLADAGSSLSGSANDQIFIPYTVAQRMFYLSGVSSFTVAAQSSDTVEQAEADLTAALTDKFGDEDSFIIMNQATMLESMSSITDTLSWMMGGIAGISLLVGGIGIMNIMLVSVAERTKEIGVRKAIGARRRNILIQFLIEALMVSTMGGLIGVGVSAGLLAVLSAALGASYGMSGGVALLAVLFSMAIGVLFGIHPANKAAKMPPIDALRAV